MADIVLTGDTSGAITVAAPSVAGTNTLTLPATTGTILDTNSTLVSSKLTGALPAIDGSALTSLSASNLSGDIPIASFPTGTILQVVSVQPDTGLISSTSTAFFEVDSDLRVTITPKASDSTLIVTCNFLFGGNNQSGMCAFKLYDITNSLNVNTTALGSRQECNSSIRDMSYDSNDATQIQLQAQRTSGSTVARTYGMYAKLESGTRYFFSNPSDTGALGYAKPSITVMEVAA